MAQPAEQIKRIPDNGVLKFLDRFYRAADGLTEARAVLTEERHSDGSTAKRTKAYGYQCAIGALEELATLVRAYAQTPEYIACLSGDEGYGCPIIMDEDFRGAAGGCVEALREGGAELGVAGDRIAATIETLLSLKCPDRAAKLGAQCEAAARMLKLEAAHA